MALKLGEDLLTEVDFKLLATLVTKFLIQPVRLI